jgi:hypothetical protein
MADRESPIGGWEGYIKDLTLEVETTYRDRNYRHEVVHDHRMMKVGPRLPEKFKASGVEFRAPLVFDLLRRIVAVINMMPVPRRIPLDSISAKAQENSSLIENWLMRFYGLMVANTYELVKDALVADGMGVFKVILDRHTWGGLEREENEPADIFNNRIKNLHRASNPFSIEHIESSTYYPIDDGKREVLEVTKRYARPLARQYGLVSQGGKLVKPTELGPKGVEAFHQSSKFIEYWNETHYVYMVDDVIVEEGDHDYGRPPYFVAYATRTSSKDPAERGISFAYPLISLQQGINEAVTMKLNWGRLNSYPSASLEPISDDVGSAFDENEPTVEITPGELMKIPAGYRFHWNEAPNVGDDLTQMLQFLLSMANEVSLSPILHGEIGSTNMSQASMTTIATIAKSIFGPGLDSLCMAFDEMAAFVLELIDRVLKEPVPLFDTSGKKGTWVEIGPDDIRGYYKVFHKIEATIPAERHQKAVVGGDLQSRGAISMREYRENWIGINDPETIDTERMIEDMRKTPQYWNFLMQKFMDRVQGVPATPATSPSNINPQAMQQLMAGQGQQVAPQGTPATPPVGPGGPGAPVVPGIQQPMAM